jgi:hypothetical protein
LMASCTPMSRNLVVFSSVRIRFVLSSIRLLRGLLDTTHGRGDRAVRVDPARAVAPDMIGGAV